MLQLISNRPFMQANTRLTKSLEKLSSGMHLNRAGDGAAELAVSESMKAQIRGMDQACRNIDDGISLIQTAEGALTEVHSMLNRMAELTTQSMNGTYSDEERKSMQEEVEQLKSEIDRIAESTQFNGIKLLDGSLKGDTVRKLDYIIAETNEGALAVEPTLKPAEFEATIDFSNITDGKTVTINGTTFEFDTDNSLHSGGVKIDISAAASSSDIAESLKNAIKNNGLGGRLESIEYDLKSGDEYTFKLKGKTQGVTNGETFSMQTGTIPDVVKGETVVDNGTDMGGGMYLLSSVEVKGIDIDTIVEGTVFSINGTTFEVDSDGILNDPSNTVVDITGGKADALDRAVAGEFPGAASVGFIKELGKDTYSFMVRYTLYNSTSDPPLDGIKFNSEIPGFVPSPPPSYSVSQNIAGVNIEGNPFEAALRKDIIDFSNAGDGCAITIEGQRFEFDSDGILDDERSIAVNINSVKSNAEIAKRFLDSFNKSRLREKFQMIANTLDSSKSSIEISSLEDFTSDGQSISIEYSSKNVGMEGLVLQIGNNVSDVMKLNIDGCGTADIGISEVDISAQYSSSFSLDSIKSAINSVSMTRAKLGAAQNRLLSTRNSLMVSVENTTAAENRISSTDMAKEMMNYTKENIIVQSAQSMLVQSQNVSKNYVQMLIQG